MKEKDFFEKLKNLPQERQKELTREWAKAWINGITETYDKFENLPQERQKKLINDWATDWIDGNIESYDDAEDFLTSTARDFDEASSHISDCFYDTAYCVSQQLKHNNLTSDCESSLQKKLEERIVSLVLEMEEKTRGEE